MLKKTKRVLLVLTLGVSFTPSVFAATRGPSSYLAKRVNEAKTALRTGEMEEPSNALASHCEGDKLLKQVGHALEDIRTSAGSAR
jgi:hypothetical protein